MPLTYERTFRVRFYECDAFGHVNNTNYLRYMLETAFDASAAGGYDQARYEEMNRTWLIRETEIEYLSPLRYGDSVTIRTWIDNFRRVRLRRVYEFYKVGDGELVAQATTDWVFMDIHSNRPASIPGDLMTAFFPEGLPKLAQRREPFPEPPSPPPGIFKMRKKVAWGDIDPAGHVNNAVYLTYIEDVGVGVCDAHNWPMERQMKQGFAIVARKHRVEYLQLALLGDELELATWFSDVRRSTAIRHYRIGRVSDGETLARARTLWVWVDLETGRPIRIPTDFLSDFASNRADTV